MQPKPKRTVDKKALQEARKQPCVVCGRSPSDAHHLTSKGAGGGDIASNLLPVCRIDHQKIHQMGIVKMAHKHPKIKKWLTKHERFDILGKIERGQNERDRTYH